jgi:hypothetical protein
MFLFLTYCLVLDLTSPSLVTTTLSETEKMASPLGQSQFLLGYVLETPTRRTRALRDGGRFLGSVKKDEKVDKKCLQGMLFTIVGLRQF